MRDVAAELKELRLHGMAGAWADLIAQGTLASLESSSWLIEHLLEVERTDRAMRSNQYRYIRCQGKKYQVLCWHWSRKGSGLRMSVQWTAVWYVQLVGSSASRRRISRTASA